MTLWYDDVILFDDIVEKNIDLSYNEVQLQLLKRREKFRSPSGGSTLLLNLFQKPTITYLYNTSDLRENFWTSKNGNINIKNYYMMNPNIIPFIDRECEDMRKGNYKRFFKLNQGKNMINKKLDYNTELMLITMEECGGVNRNLF